MECILETSECRIAPRVEMQVQVEVRRLWDSEWVMAETMDISAGGLGLRVVGSSVWAALTDKERLAFRTFEEFFFIQGVGQVQWVDSEHRSVGISFLKFKKRQRRLLRDFLSLCM